MNRAPKDAPHVRMGTVGIGNQKEKPRVWFIRQGVTEMSNNVIVIIGFSCLITIYALMAFVVTI